MTKSGGGEELHLKKQETLAERNFAPVVWFTTRKMEGLYLLQGKWKVFLPSQFSKKNISPVPRHNNAQYLFLGLVPAFVLVETVFLV